MTDVSTADLKKDTLCILVRGCAAQHLDCVTIRCESTKTLFRCHIWFEDSTLKDPASPFYRGISK